MEDIRISGEDGFCSVCGRTMLIGESVDSYHTTAGEQREVCDLCRDRVEQQGWRRVVDQDGVSLSAPRQRPRRWSLGSWLDKRGRAGEEAGFEPGVATSPPRATAKDLAGRDEDESAVTVDTGWKSKPSAAELETSGAEPQKVHAIPVSNEGKIEQAVKRFNESEHTRTVAGIVRALGKPSAAVARPDEPENEVKIVIAWELTWYQFLVDLADSNHSVHLLSKGDEISEIPDELQSWNAEIDDEGNVSLMG